MSSAAATSLISTPDRLLSFTAVALNRSPYLATLRGPALATTHLQAVSPRCQLIRGNLGVACNRGLGVATCARVTASVGEGPTGFRRDPGTPLPSHSVLPLVRARKQRLWLYMPESRARSRQCREIKTPGQQID